MNPETETAQKSSETFIDQILLAIARRADELARLRIFHTGLNTACWFKAEDEILGSSIDDDRNAGAGLA